MAIPHVLIAKIGSGFLAAGSVGAVGATYRKEIFDSIKNLFFNNEDTVFLIVKKVSNSTPDASLANNELYETTGKKERKFKCVTSDSTKTDYKCDIFTFLPKNAQTNKLIGLKELNSTTDNIKATKEKISSDTFFKLQVKKNIFNVEDKKIKLISTEVTTEKQEKKYVEFDVLYRIDGNKVTGKTNLIIGKAKNKNGETIDISKGTKCFIATIKDDTKEECAIYKFETQLKDGDDHKELVFSSTHPKTPVAFAELTNSHLYLIDLKTKKIDTDSQIKETVIVYEKENGSTKTIVEFDLVSPLASSTEAFEPTTSSVFYLN